MGKKKRGNGSSKGVSSTEKSSVKHTDRWASIEKGEARSAASLHFKAPSDEPKFVHPAKLAKPKKIHDGLDVSRVLMNGKQSGGTKRKHQETPPKLKSKKQKKNEVAVKKVEKKKEKKVGTTSSTPVVELLDDDDDVLFVPNGGKAAVVERDEFGGLSSDDEFEEEEEFEDEMDEDETDIDEEEMVLRPEDIARYIDGGEEEVEDEEVDFDDEELEDEEEFEDEEGEEVEDEEGNDESDVSEMDADSDDEGFIAGKHRETHVIKAEKSPRPGKPVDFDKFPFTDHNSVVTASRAFGFLISPCDVQTFFDKWYQSNVMVVHRKHSSFYGNLFSTARLCELLEKNHLEYGSNINIAQYKGGIRTTLNGSGRVYPQIVKQHLNNLCSVQLVNPQTFDDRIWYLCEVIQELFGCFVGANTYLTPAGSSGFAPHWDEIDAFLLQVEGRKYWRVWAPEHPEDELPLESSDNFTEEEMKDREPVFEGWIEAGDLIYIPRGFIHQARTDDNVHSLHVTVSTGRKWSFADLMEKVVPEAVGALSENRQKLRRGLPIGLFDMGGVVDLDYSQEDHFVEKFKIVVDRHMSMLRNLVADGLLESAVDSMAKEFMKQALPPLLTEKEKKHSVLGSSINLLGDDLVVFTARTEVRLIRKHTQRLLMESEDSCFISHRMNNSRLFEGRPEQIVEFPASGIDVFRVLSNSYPEWRTLDSIFSSQETKTSTRKEKLDAIQRLFQIGVLLINNKE
ncbi:unnamed protein product [Caenorhabditis sp. 36 PRJEB53466]|nr:unnamed protein product [Caenorhabditis sp. 36 PRJEB53466]